MPLDPRWGLVTQEQTYRDLCVLRDRPDEQRQELSGDDVRLCLKAR